MNNNKLIYSTERVYSPKTWIIRLIILVTLIIIINSGELIMTKWFGEGVNDGYKTILSALTFFITFVFPVDEIEVYENQILFKKVIFFHLGINKETYDYSNIKSIGIGGTRTKGNELNRFSDSHNSINIIFNDNSSCSIETAVYRDDLTWVLNTVRELLKKE